MSVLYLIIFLISTATAQYVRGVVNGNVRLPCRKINPRSNICWSVYTEYILNSKYIVINNTINPNYNDKRINLFFSQNYANLTLTNLSLSDAGAYTCEEYNNSTTAMTHMSTLRLTVVNPFIAINNVTINIGDSWEFNCTIKSPEEFWVYKNNTFISLQPSNASKLLIQNVSIFDSGIYYCFKNVHFRSARVVVIEPIMLPICQNTIWYAIITVLSVIFVITILLLLLIILKLVLKPVSKQKK